MPAPQASVLSNLAKMLFLAKGIQLPMNWSQPGDQYPDAFKPDEIVVAPNPPTTLFIQATLNKYHVDTARQIGQKFEDYIDGICGGICDGIDKWMKMTTIMGVMINGPVGMLLPGCVVGAPLMPLILATAPMSTPQEIRYSTAIANAFGTAWQAWQSGLTGMIMYPPTFAACPSPVHPPTPNIPMPLITLASPGEAGLSPSALKASMMGFFGDPTALHAMDLFDAISSAFGVVFQIFKATTLVQNVLGFGPVPTFAPPFVPVGPVLMGTGMGAPGCLS